jgi:hypothetical protein
MSLPWTRSLGLHSQFVTSLRLRFTLSHSTVLPPHSLKLKDTVPPPKEVTWMSLGIDQTPLLPPQAGLN